MTSFLQDTDSQSWPESGLHDLTTSIEGQADTFRLRGESNPTRQARDIVSQIQNPNVAEQLDKLLSLIDKIFYYVAQQRGVEPNPDDSGYHMVSNKKLSERTESGQLANMGEIIIFLLKFIFTNI